ncbi:MAG: phosphoglucosamine mutase [Verrucomicrobiales bacterium]|nr:phosphoglucosamine mutase [Verrucomicrobiales bacterium]
MSEREFFGTDGIRGPANVFPLTPDFAVRLGRAAAEVFLRKRGEVREWPVVVIGKDTRQSCDMLESAIASGIASCGVDVRLAGVLPTPGVARLTVEERALFGVVISASHNPFQDNGIKFFGPDGYKLADEEEMEIEKRVGEDRESDGSKVGRISPLGGAVERYVAFVRSGTGSDPELFAGLTIALDAANGASYETSAAVLRSLGAKVLSFHDQPNGININEDCGCTHAEVIESIVRETGADVGISHDGDADRVLLCDETGSVLDGDELMAIAAIGLLEKGRLAEKTLVATVMSNAGLEEAVQKAGGKVVRAGVGDRYVMEEMKEHGYNFGGEQSGHFIFRDHNTTGDGIVSAVQLLQIMKEKGQPLSELRKVLTRFPQVQRNIRVHTKPVIETLAAASIIQEIRETLGDAGRVMLRYSGTEPLLRVLLEGKDADWIDDQADRLAASIEAEIGA